MTPLLTLIEHQPATVCAEAIILTRRLAYLKALAHGLSDNQAEALQDVSTRSSVIEQLIGIQRFG